MCGGARFEETTPLGLKQEVTVYFPNPSARLPVLDAAGQTVQLPWGKRERQYPDLKVPQGGWARIESLEAGKWDWLQPEAVRLPVTAWMEKDKARHSHWFPMEAGRTLRGVAVKAGDLRLVYVVTQEASADFAAQVHHRVPVFSG